VAFIACPSCGSSNLRSSQVRGSAEKFKSFFGFLPFRCRQCSERFTSTIWNLRVIRYARCPKCLRMELSTWSEQFYLAPLSTRLFLRMGATPYRCEFCRCNFASFRRCKERFSWRKRRKAIADANLAAQAQLDREAEVSAFETHQVHASQDEAQELIQTDPETSDHAVSPS
jgi:hypothetical protein